MRRRAYKQAITDARKLPDVVYGLAGYFKDNYDPRRSAIRYIMAKARMDDGLFDGEFVALYQWEANTRRMAATEPILDQYNA